MTGDVNDGPTPVVARLPGAEAVAPWLRTLVVVAGSLALVTLLIWLELVGRL